MAKTEKIDISFAAINKAVVDNIPSPDEKVNKNYDWVVWGDENKWPNYLYDLYYNVPTLHSIIDGMVDYVVGDGIVCNVSSLQEQEAKKLAISIAKSLLTYGGCAINVTRNKFGQVALAKPLDMRCVRTSKDNGQIFYSEKFRDAKNYWTKSTVTEFLPYKKDGDIPSTILFYKNTEYQTYPSPMYAGAVISCELERKINEYFLNTIENNFSSNFIVCLNNGVPEDEQKEEIERNFSEKFCGSANAGRVAIAYSQDKDHAPVIEQIKQDDWAERFKSLRNRCRQEIFTSMRCNPNLFGIPTENLGFSSEEYESAFKLFNRTVIQPLQMEVCEVMDMIYGDKCITIKPFTIDFDGNKQDVEEVENNDVKIANNE